uniref:Uncharacterized protein n=1 Tax=Strigamia maritima TaxID=126957 RepID=T1JI90_STRMM
YLLVSSEKNIFRSQAEVIVLEVYSSENYSKKILSNDLSKTLFYIAKMPLGCGLTVCKWILGFFNLLIFICGAAVLGTGIWLAIDKKSMLTILKATEALSEDPTVQNFNAPSVLEQAAYILIGAGAIIFLLGFLGCCGAFQESKCMLSTYAVFLTIFLGVEIGAGVYAGTAKAKFEKNLRSLLVLSLKSYKAEKDALTMAWDYAFSEFECCGVNDYRDMESAPWYKNRSIVYDQKFPQSCCEMENKAKFEATNPNCPFLTSLKDKKKANTGCYDAIKKWGEEHMTLILGIAVGLGSIQILADQCSNLPRIKFHKFHLFSNRMKKNKYFFINEPIISGPEFRLIEKTNHELELKTNENIELRKHISDLEQTKPLKNKCLPDSTALRSSRSSSKTSYNGNYEMVAQISQHLDIETLIKKTDAETDLIKCDSSLSTIEVAKIRINELETQIQTMQDQQNEQEQKHHHTYLQMYKKGQEAAKFQHADEVLEFAHQAPNRVSVPELLKQLHLTEQELNQM